MREHQSFRLLHLAHASCKFCWLVTYGVATFMLVPCEVHAATTTCAVFDENGNCSSSRNVGSTQSVGPCSRHQTENDSSSLPFWNHLNCILTYAGSRTDCIVNYSVLLITALYCAYQLYYGYSMLRQLHQLHRQHEQLRHLSTPTIRAASLSFVFVTVFQVSLCWVVGCTGVSIIWCAMCGWTLSERRRQRGIEQQLETYVYNNLQQQQQDEYSEASSSYQGHQRRLQQEGEIDDELDSSVQESSQPLLGSSTEEQSQTQPSNSTRMTTTPLLEGSIPDEEQRSSSSSLLQSQESRASAATMTFMRRRTRRKQTVEGLVLSLNFGTIAYYAITSEAITTVAHICALVLGAMCSLVSVPRPESTIDEDIQAETHSQYQVLDDDPSTGRDSANSTELTSTSNNQ